MRNFNGYGEYDIRIKLETSGPLKSFDEVTELVNKEVEAYLINLEDTCQAYKRLIYDYLRAYQDEQKRQKEDIPSFQ